MGLKFSLGFKRLGVVAIQKLTFPQRARGRSISVVGVYIMKWGHISDENYGGSTTSAIKLWEFSTT
jgi:hypothetical protein